MRLGQHNIHTLTHQRLASRQFLVECAAGRSLDAPVAAKSSIPPPAPRIGTAERGSRAHHNDLDGIGQMTLHGGCRM